MFWLTHSEIDVMAEALEELKAKHDSLPPQVAEAQAAHDAEKATLDEATSMLESMRVTQQASMAELAHSMDQFGSRLGLYLENSGGALNLEYSLIDPDDLEKRHTLTVKVTDEQVYEIVGVSPMFQDLEVLLAELNVSNDFKKFV
eukprot:SAG22_NODE_8897_length_623_cov_0.870229_1_plen_144_part_10